MALPASLLRFFHSTVSRGARRRRCGPTCRPASSPLGASITLLQRRRLAEQRRTEFIETEQLERPASVVAPSRGRGSKPLHGPEHELAQVVAPLPPRVALHLSRSRAREARS